jgi:hypothetical protein
MVSWNIAEEVTGSKRPDIIGPGQLALGWWVRWEAKILKFQMKKKHIKDVFCL